MFCTPRIMIKIVICFLFCSYSYISGTTSDSCGSNEINDNCGTVCPATCQVPDPGPCADVCSSGCFCEEGYIRANLKGPCIPSDSCKDACRDNEEFRFCGLTCPPSCTQPIPTCANNCCAQGCFCKDGYVLEEVSQTCVKEDECPKL